MELKDNFWHSKYHKHSPTVSQTWGPSRYNWWLEISKMGRELQKWAAPPKWGGVSSSKDFHHWLWLQPIVIDLHFKITLYKLNKILVYLNKICLYKSIFSLRAEPKARGQWCSEWYKRFGRAHRDCNIIYQFLWRYVYSYQDSFNLQQWQTMVHCKTQTAPSGQRRCLQDGG